MRALGVGSVIFAIGCGSGPQSGGIPPGGGAGTSLDAGGTTSPDSGGTTSPDASTPSNPDAASAPDAAVAALSAGAIVFAAALNGQAATDLYVLDGGTVTRLTQTTGGELYPAISPDRMHIAFVRDFQLFTVDAAGRNERLVAQHTGRQRLTGSGQVYSTTLGPAAWSPDGTQLAYPYPRDPMPNTDPTDMIDESYGTTLHIINADGTADHLVSSDINGTVNSIGWTGDTISFAMGIDCPDCAGGQEFGFIKPDGTGYSALFFTWPSGHRTPNKHLDTSPDAARWTFVITNDYAQYDTPGDIYTSTAFVDDATLRVAASWNPRWSSDGTKISFIGSDGIYTMPAMGGAPARALAATGLRGLDW